MDTHGKEISGTRTSQKSPNCMHPRSCPILSCRKQCLLGFEMNDLGCATCECKNPCLNVECPFNHVCRIIPTQCFLTKCSFVPRCILNACPRGEPLERPENGILNECDDRVGQLCPQGWFCHRFGMAGLGYCCAGAGTNIIYIFPQLVFLVPQSQTQPGVKCPTIPMLVQPRHESLSHLECKLNHDCIKNGPCCFNGVGTSCEHGVIQAASESTLSPIQAVTSVMLNAEKIGVCPSNPISNPGCRSDCTRDSECHDFQKCCIYGCGRLCQYPRVATACIHKLASFSEEISKLHESSENSEKKPPVQCTSDGLFRRIQCDHLNRQCWCVDVNSGIEIIGTRITSLTGQEPNCLSELFFYIFFRGYK